MIGCWKLYPKRNWKQSFRWPVLLETMGCLMDKEKCVLLPSQRIPFTAMILDSVKERVFLLEKRFFFKYSPLYRDFLQSSQKLMYFLVILGLMASTMYVTPHARLRIKQFQHWLLKNFKCSTDNGLKILTILRKTYLYSGGWNHRMSSIECSSFHHFLHWKSPQLHARQAGEHIPGTFSSEVCVATESLCYT